MIVAMPVTCLLEALRLVNSTTTPTMHLDPLVSFQSNYKKTARHPADAIVMITQRVLEVSGVPLGRNPANRRVESNSTIWKRAFRMGGVAKNVQIVELRHYY